MIDKRSLYRIWAPPGEPWSGWVKPVLFAHWPREVPELGALPPCDTSWAPPPSERRALLVEMPGVDAVAMGLALAEAGYRPVPLFNASPPPIPPRHPLEPPLTSPAVVDVESILGAIVKGAEALGNLEILPTAPPAFLIDQFRSTPSRPLMQGVYDNRSWVYATDFPSADRFRNEGITGVILATASRESPASDLEHVLRTWAGSGLDIDHHRPGESGLPAPLELGRPSWLDGIKLWWRSRYLLDPVLGHGSFVPGSSG
jgi:hypothetical protein